jgi:DNA (cytosine-5)-methyltransferase 1
MSEKTLSNSLRQKRFIDLFAGIGGFHQALNKLGYKCVYACDTDAKCREVYETNYKIKPDIDILKLDVKDLKDFEVLCAGFPCQPFSNGGKKKSFTDTRGNLFMEIIRIAKEKKPEFMILENVKHIMKIQNGKVFETILKHIKETGYKVSVKQISPHELGVPQQRERIIFMCIRNDVFESRFKSIHISETNPIINNYNDFEYKLGLNENVEINFNSFFEKNTDSKFNISDELKEVLNAWDEIIQKINIGDKLSPTILPHEFKTLTKIIIDGQEKDCPTFKLLPNWKQDYILKNKPIYNKYKKEWDEWYNKHKTLLSKKEIYSKLEWQAGPKKSNDTIWNYFIQMRQSGIRVKKIKYFPTLVAIVQTPIYGKEKRYITPCECAKLQSFPETFKCHSNDNTAYKHFGNAVNVDVIYKAFSKLLENDTLLSV